MSEQNKLKCAACENVVDDGDLDRWGECPACKAAERATDMGVGDLNTK